MLNLWLPGEGSVRELLMKVIEDDIGMQEFDPTAIAYAAMNYGLIDRLRPINSLASELSLQPAVYFRTSGVELRLAPKELSRLIYCQLERSEFFALRQLHGVFHELHDDFYDPETGTSLQPVEGDDAL